jgi:hypothetical protein
MTRYAALKRSVNNDKSEFEDDIILCKEFDRREEAAMWLANKYEPDVLESEWDADNYDWKLLYDFLMTSSQDDAIFQWEWKRRGNFRQYKIIEIGDDVVLRLFVKTKNLYKLKDGVIKLKKINRIDPLIYSLPTNNAACLRCH